LSAPAWRCEKRISFCDAILYYRGHHCTKPGSGQTSDKLTKETRLLAARSPLRLPVLLPDPLCYPDGARPRARGGSGRPRRKHTHTHTHTVCFVHRVLVVMKATICQDRLRTPHTKRVFVDNNASPLFVRLFFVSCSLLRFLFSSCRVETRCRSTR
jgi:hypothetical protein